MCSPSLAAITAMAATSLAGTGASIYSGIEQRKLQEEEMKNQGKSQAELMQSLSNNKDVTQQKQAARRKNASELSSMPGAKTDMTGGLFLGSSAGTMPTSGYAMKKYLGG